MDRVTPFYARQKGIQKEETVDEKEKEKQEDKVTKRYLRQNSGSFYEAANA